MPYKRNFKDYPYDKFYKSLESGKVDFDNDTIEVGQIYIFVRRHLYSVDASDDLIAVKTILPQQLKYLFSPPYATQKHHKTYGDMLSISNGITTRKVMSQIPMDDVFFMSCVSIDANTYKDRAWGGNQAINETGKVVDNPSSKPAYLDNPRQGSVEYSINFKYCEAYKILKLIRTGGYKSFDSQLMFNHLGEDNKFMFNCLGEDKYSGGLENILSWAYIFKVPINTPIRDFMNWNSNPFT